MSNSDKVLTLVTGWNLKSVLNDDICDAARKIGWEAQTVTEIDRKDMAENKLENYFSKYVLWRRSLLNASDYENNRAWCWLNRHCDATMNTHVVGLNTIPVDKYFQHGVFSLDARLKDYVLSMYMVDSREDIGKLLLARKISFPFVMKDRFGTAGRDIVLFLNSAEVSAYEGKWRNMAVEPYVEADCDWRVFVIGGVAIGIMRKTGNPDDPRDFRAKSGGYHKVNEDNQKVRDQLIRIASDVASAMHLEYAGVDVIQDRNTGRYYLMEVNLAAGWMNGFSQITGADVALAMAKWFEARRDLKYLTVAEVVQKYLKEHLGCVTTATQQKYREIMSGKGVKTGNVRGDIRIDDFVKEKDLAGRLRWLYDRAVLCRGELTSDEWRILNNIGKVVLKESESHVSWAGNYIGADMLEDGVINTAYYLAIKEALK